MFEQKENWERGKRLAKRKQLILFNLIQLINYGESTERDETQQLYHISSQMRTTIQHTLLLLFSAAVHCSGQSPVEFNIFALLLSSPRHIRNSTRHCRLCRAIGNSNRKSEWREKWKVQGERTNEREEGKKNVKFKSRSTHNGRQSQHNMI